MPTAPRKRNLAVFLTALTPFLKHLQQTADRIVLQFGILTRRYS